MAYRTEKTNTGNDLVISDFDKGIAASPHKGIANMKAVNLSTESGEVMCSLNRINQLISTAISGTLTPLTNSTVSFSSSVPAGSWFHIVSDSGTSLSGDYYYLGSNQIASTYNGTAISNIRLGALVTVFLTSGTTWTVPADFGALNTVECIGGGAGGGGGTNGGGGSTGSGGGGGGYSKISNLTLTPSGSVTYTIGAAGTGGSNADGTSGGDTYFNGASLGASSVGAKGGVKGVESAGGGAGAGGVGGASGSGVGTTKYSGGAGGAVNAGGDGNGGGGGGGAGLNGIGGVGGAHNAGGAGGQGDNATGGVGGSSAGTPNGAAGTEFGSSKGSGGGGWGANAGTATNGGNGGLYGAGGGGGTNNGASSNGGNGTQGFIRITYYSATPITTSATYTVYVMGKPIMSATEPYTDSSNAQQYRYYILDDAGQIWVHDTAITSSVWFMPQAPYALAGRIASGLAVLNGWVTYTLADRILWFPTVILGQAGSGSSAISAITTGFHATLTASAAGLYYTDGNVIGSVIPNTGLLTTGAINIQSFCSYTAVTTTGTIAIVISGTQPRVPNTTIRIPVVFFTAGTKPAAITVGTIYWIKWLNNSTPDFEVYAASSGGSAIDIETGAVGTQYFNTFYPINTAGQTAIVITAQNLFLPTFETAQALVDLSGTILIGCKSNIVYAWNKLSLTPQNSISLPENNTVNIINVNNSGYIFNGQKGNIYITNGSSASQVISVPDYCAGIKGTPATYYEPYFTWGGGMYLRGRVWFSILDQTATKTGNCGGIWSFIPTNNFYQGQDQGLALRLENQNSYGTYNGVSTVLLPSQVQTVIAPQYWSGWYSSITSPTYGIDFSDTIPTPSAIIETDLIPTGTLLGKKTFQQIEYKLSTPLANGETVGISYRQNSTDAFTSCGTVVTESTTALSGYFVANFENGQWLQLQITLNPLASSSSSFVRLKEVRVR